jgi:hypothetical protein
MAIVGSVASAFWNSARAQNLPLVHLRRRRQPAQPFRGRAISYVLWFLVPSRLVELVSGFVFLPGFGVPALVIEGAGTLAGGRQHQR